MEDLLKYLQDMLGPLGYPGIAAFLAAISAGFGLIVKLVARLRTLYRQRKLNRDLFPLYTEMEIQRATQYYVETKVQNVAPSRYDEPDRGYAVAARGNIIRFFLKKAFRPATDDGQFYIVLADSGMGKTTFLLNLYLRYHEQFFGTSYRMKLFPLGNPDIDKELDKMSDDEKHQTILLLDAFDEDIRAVEDYRARLEELILKTRHFREIVITCRTQFFPSEEEEPKETGVMRYGAEGGEHVFYKFYLSPFDEQDIRAYLRKRFPWYQRAKRQRARQIVKSCPNLMVRPMLLSYIEDLLQSERAYTTAYQVYLELIDRWIDRETHKVAPDRRKHYKEEVYRFCRAFALDLYRRRSERQGRLLINGAEIQSFAEKHGITLSEMEMKSKSLLNRNARGEYKFAHKSVLEYFLAEEAFFNPDFRRELSFEGIDQAQAFFEEMIREKLTLPFFSRSDLKGEYCLEDGKPRVLTKLAPALIPRITSLTLPEWKDEDDVLLFRGLKNLKRLNLNEKQFSDIKALEDLFRRGGPFEWINSPYRSGNLIQELERGKTDMFYGREETIRRLRQILIRDDDSLVILYGQRRTGKSCFMKYLEKERLFEPDAQIVFVDMQGLSSEQDFYDCVLRSMNAIVCPDQDYLSRTTSFHDFSASLRQLLDDANQCILIMIDEFEHVTAEHFKYTSLANADEFIQKIRHLMQHTPQVKFALAGADGLRAMINDYDNPLFNAGRTLHIGFLKRQEARDLISRPLRGTVNYTEPAIAKIQETAYNHPYFIQCLCQRIVDVLNEKERYTVAAAEVVQAIEAFHKHENDKFDYVWEKTRQDEHLVLAIIAREMHEGTKWVAIERIEDVMTDNDFPVQGDIRDGPVKHLLQKDFVFEHDSELAYTIPMGLLHTWLTRYKPLTRVRREILV